MSLTVNVDLGPLREALDALGAGNLPKTAQAVQDSTLIAQRLWLSVAGGHSIQYQGRDLKINRVSGAYARSIQDGMEYPVGGDAMHGRVSANAEYAQSIEDGTPAHDMKPGLLGGEKARLGKKGQRYNIIPFRHNTPGQDKTAKAMPSEIYNQVKRLAFSQSTGERVHFNALGQFTRRKTYSWGGRLGNMGPGAHRQGPRIRRAAASFLEPGIEDKSYTHTTSIFSGMVRMGQPKQASYMTFRVVSELSPANSWWSPGVEPRPISAAVSETIRPQIEALIRQAFEDDLTGLTGE